MQIRLAVRDDVDDVGHLARLLAIFAEGEEPEGTAFAPDLLRWWAEHDSHLALLAVLPSGNAVGMAWLALTARVPRPGGGARLCGDVQSVYVVPEHRSTGVGTALMHALVQHAEALGLEHVTVHSNVRANSLYERAGFTPSTELVMRTWR